MWHVRRLGGDVIKREGHEWPENIIVALIDSTQMTILFIVLIAIAEFGFPSERI